MMSLVSGFLVLRRLEQMLSGPKCERQTGEGLVVDLISFLKRETDGPLVRASKLGQDSMKTNYITLWKQTKE